MNWVGWVLAFWNVVQSVVELMLAGAIVYFAWASWRVSGRLARLAGATQAHADIMLRLEARKQEIPMVWWDPTLEASPYEAAAHGEACRLEKIAVVLPEHLRRYEGREARKREKALRRSAREKLSGASARA